MIPVTEQFKAAIGAASRQTKAKVLFRLVDVDAAEDTTVTATSEAIISKKSQITNAIMDMTGKLATLETDYWKLDGTFVLPPTVEEAGYEVGWWSDALSGPEGTFPVPQVVTLQFTKDHSSIGFTIYFDALTDEYAADFIIDVYDSLDVLLHSEMVTGNILVRYILEHTIENYRKVVITITKWKLPNRRARIVEVSMGVIYEYTGNELISVNVLEEVDTINNEVSSNETKFTIENQDKRFNIMNPTGAYPALQKLQTVVPYLGVVKTDGSTEYVGMGVYYLDEWQSDEGALTASFTAHDLLNVISRDEYAGDTFVAETLYAIAVEILTAAGVRSVDHNVDTALQGISTSGTLEKMSYREALQKIAIAGMAVLYCSREGKIIIEQIGTDALSETIGLDNMYASPLIKLDSLVNTIYIKSGDTTYTYTDPTKTSDEQVLSIEIDNPLIDTSGKADVVAAWIMAEYKKRFLYEVNWRMDPSFTVGDIVTIEDDFSADKTARITRQEFTFTGYLTGKTNGKGGGT